MNNTANIMEQLTQAIHNRNVVKVLYDGEVKTIEPYLIFNAANGNTLLHGYKTSDDEHWVNAKLHKIDQVVIDGTYDEPRKGYNPDSKQFKEVLLATARGPE